MNILRRTGGRYESPQPNKDRNDFEKNETDIQFYACLQQLKLIGKLYLIIINIFKKKKIQFYLNEKFYSNRVRI